MSPVRRANPWPLHQSAHCGQNPLLLFFFLTFEPTFMISCCLHRAENGASSSAICCRCGRSTSCRGPAQPPSANCSPADTCDATPEDILSTSETRLISVRHIRSCDTGRIYEGVVGEGRVDGFLAPQRASAVNSMCLTDAGCHCDDKNRLQPQLTSGR